MPDPKSRYFLPVGGAPGGRDVDGADATDGAVHGADGGLLAVKLSVELGLVAVDEADAPPVRRFGRVEVHGRGGHGGGSRAPPTCTTMTTSTRDTWSPTKH